MTKCITPIQKPMLGQKLTSIILRQKNQMSECNHKHASIQLEKGF